MLQTLEAIVERLAAGEDSFVEFKEVRVGATTVLSPNADELASEIVGFANAEGGTIFLGVAGDGSLQGISDDSFRKVEEWAVNVATNNCDPPVRPIIRSVALPTEEGPAKRIMLLEVKKGLYVHRTSRGRWHIRVGSTKRDLTQAELSRLFQERGRTFVFDETPVFTSTAENLDNELLESLLGTPKRIDRRQLLVNRRVVVEDDEGALRPTVAGLLCFCRDPSEHLAGAHIHAAVYRGTRHHSDDLVHSEEIRGPVNCQLEEALRFVDRFMLKPARKDVGREDHPQYALGAVLEAIVNAVAHRDYSIAGSKIRLFLYADRLELRSPGGLPNTLTPETMRYRQFTRNQLLVSFLSKMRSQRDERFFIEERGEGVARIIEESTVHSGRAPVYVLHGDELQLTIWAKASPHGEA